jgi:hypothetical protein
VTQSHQTLETISFEQVTLAIESLEPRSDPAIRLSLAKSSLNLFRNLHNPITKSFILTRLSKERNADVHYYLVDMLFDRISLQRIDEYQVRTAFLQEIYLCLQQNAFQKESSYITADVRCWKSLVLALKKVVTDVLPSLANESELPIEAWTSRSGGYDFLRFCIRYPCEAIGKACLDTSIELAKTQAAWIQSSLLPLMRDITTASMSHEIFSTLISICLGVWPYLPPIKEEWLEFAESIASSQLKQPKSGGDHAQKLAFQLCALLVTHEKTKMAVIKLLLTHLQTEHDQESKHTIESILKSVKIS